MSRLLSLLLVAALLAGCGQTPPSSASAVTIPAGWQPLAQPDLSLALPPDWQVITSEDADLGGAVDTAATANPQLATVLDGARAALVSGELRLVAYDLAPEHLDEPFITNVTVGVVPSAGASLAELRKVNLAQLQAQPGFHDVVPGDATLAGLPALQLSYGLDVKDAGGAPLALHVEQFIAVQPPLQYVLTFSTTPTQTAAFLPTFQQIVSTARLAPAATPTLVR